jgi:alpha-glucosidase
LVIFSVTAAAFAASDDLKVTSPDGKTVVTASTESGIELLIEKSNKQLLTISAIDLSLSSNSSLATAAVVKNSVSRSNSDFIKPIVPTKTAQIANNYNELVITFEGDYSLHIRAFDNGIAYRWATAMDGQLKVINETANFSFPADHKIYFPEEESLLSHSEREYKYLALSEISTEQFCSLPALVDLADGSKIAITESDLYDYPGLYLKGTGTSSLNVLLPAYPAEEEQTRDRTVKVSKREEYIAQTDGERTYPWRVVAIADSDADLITNQLVFQLARENQLEDSSWIKPGKVAWDWWNANNVYNVNFRAGINTATYKYYAHFAAENDIEYIILDEGWSETTDLLKVNPDIDMPVVIDHAEHHGVGVILWVLWNSLDNQLDETLDQFQKWGVRGIKVDFMQRDDQKMVNYYWRIAREAAKRNLLVDFHGSYKPAGLRRAFPNVMTREGLKGLEHSKWNTLPTPKHNLTLPFIRMLAGPMDYTPGSMINTHPKNFKPFFERPMSIGTRAHQLALYVAFESPLQMLADSPTNYIREPKTMEFLSVVPSTWDDTIVLDAKIGEYLLIARRNGEEWYVGAMTDQPRQMELDLSFLGDGEFEAAIYQDGINADRHASDFDLVKKLQNSTDKLTISMVSGGGWAARFSPADGNHFETPEKLLTKFYQMITFPAGSQPNWNEVSKLFRKDAKIVMPSSKTETTTYGFWSFFNEFAEFTEEQNFGYQETVVSMKSQVYGNIAHVYVVYKSSYTDSNYSVQYGLDSIQLLKENGKWLIYSVIGQFPQDEKPLPMNLLK